MGELATERDALDQDLEIARLGERVRIDQNRVERIATGESYLSAARRAKQAGAERPRRCGRRVVRVLGSDERKQRLKDVGVRRVEIAPAPPERGGFAPVVSGHEWFGRLEDARDHDVILEIPSDAR